MVAKGRSPFERATYRYTPFLAWLLLPNVIFPEFGKFLYFVKNFLGKILFCFVDILIGWILFRISLEDLRSLRNKISLEELGENIYEIKFGISVFWLFNPFIMIISARGSADSLVCAAVLLTLYLLKKNKVF